MSKKLFGENTPSFLDLKEGQKEFLIEHYKRLENFGEFVVPDLMSTFNMLINPKWKTMEMLLNTETTIHKVVRLKNPGAEPPRLQFTQTGPNTLKFNYNSPRRMSAVAKGIMKGVAKHYGETVEIQERKSAGGSSEMMITIK
ncbi:MAG: heme NO-binding domain-containing protein [Candidatus Binatia bacterium]